MLATIPGIEIRRFEPQPGIVSLLARLHGRKPGRRLIFKATSIPFRSVTRRTGPFRRFSAQYAMAGSTDVAHPI
jgi:hypothetical protein